MSTATFPAYAVLLHINDGFDENGDPDAQGTGYWAVGHIEPVANGAALKAYKKAVQNFLDVRTGKSKAYLVCMNLLAGPGTNFDEAEE